MAKPIQRHGARVEQALMRDIGLSAQNIEHRKKAAGFGADDVRRIKSIKPVVLEHVAELSETFFDYLAGLEEARPLLENRELLKLARTLKAEHLVAMVQGPYELGYIEQRIRLALVYSRAGLEPRAFFGAFRHLIESIGVAIMKRAKGHALDAFESFMSLQKIAFLDLAVIVDVLVFERERVIRQQQEAIRELSTPVLQIRDRLLLLPIIGVIDTHRAQLITENLLRAIRSNRAKVVVMDVTGVATIDSRVANHLLQTVTAAKLMGAMVIVTGLSSDVAQSLVALGIDLAKLNTVGDLQGGLEEAEHALGYRVLHGAPPLPAPPTLQENDAATS